MKRVQSSAEGILSAQDKQCVKTSSQTIVKDVRHETGRGERIADFARRHRLRLSSDELGERVILGKLGDIYEYSPRLLGVMFMPQPSRPKIWPAARNMLSKAGFTIRQNGDEEGAATFNPHDLVQAKLAIKVLRIRAIRVLSPAERESRRERIQRINTSCRTV
jgi:hypothetical protein